MIHLIQYDAQSFQKFENLLPAEASEKIIPSSINWIDVDKADKNLVEETASLFNIHPLITEDILDTDHLPKFEAFEDHIFLSLKMLRLDKTTSEISTEHLNIVLTDHVLITFQEGVPGDVFDDLRRRLAQGKGLVRKNSIVYLLYHCLDAVVDHYLEISEKLREEMEVMETKLIRDTRFDAPEEVMRLKKKINMIRRYTIPFWDAFRQMQTECQDIFHKGSKVYFQDISDHIKYLISFFDTSREMLRDIMDLYQSNLNNEMNKVMKTLTIVSAIFIPMTFLAGVYGMNFDYMPELHFKWGYASIWGLMGVSTIAMIFVMRSKKWL
jgi:magnesium transporter